MRRIVAALAVVAASTVAAPPAQASSSFHVYGEAYVDCFGCGISSGTADLWVTGVYDNQVVFAEPGLTPPNGHAVFDYDQPAATCPLIGSASGAVRVVLSHRSFVWTRVGSTAIVTIPGVGTAVVQVLVVDPIGNPCGATAGRMVFSGSGG